MKNLSLYTTISVLVLMASCVASKKAPGLAFPVFDTEAHRGGKGLMPENTIPAMLNAIELGVSTLEMDLQISKDKKVIVSHDPYFNHNFTTTPEGKFLSAAESRKLLLYNMDYSNIKRYDVGLKYYPDYPQQKKIAVHKPLLADLIDAAEKYAAGKGRKMLYNIEIKSNRKNDGINHPPVAEFVDLAMKVILQKGIGARTIIQSFDPRALIIMRRKYPAVATSLLIEGSDKRSLDEQLHEIGFVPVVYSPHHSLVTRELIEACHAKNMKVVPWTVNDVSRMKTLIALKVDGIISDYPNLFAEALH